LRSVEEIKKAIEDYTHMKEDEFGDKYRLRSVYEAYGFVKALRWVLELP